MKLLTPPLSTGESPLPPDEMDALLSAYFRAEMPHPWPASPLARTIRLATTVESARPALSRSRWALAASVALLLGGACALPGRLATSPVEPLPRLQPGEATRPPLPGEDRKIQLHEMFVQPKDKPTEWRFEVFEEVPPGK